MRQDDDTPGYEEILEGVTFFRQPPGARHEGICARLHEWVAEHLPPDSILKQLPPRSVVQVSAGSMVRPDLALVLANSQTVWMIAEIVNVTDHRIDTVRKKELYEWNHVPRLWMVDPRYDNLEIYHATSYGMTLQAILAGKDLLTDDRMPSLKLPVADLFEV